MAARLGHVSIGQALSEHSGAAGDLEPWNEGIEQRNFLTAELAHNGVVAISTYRLGDNLLSGASTSEGRLTNGQGRITTIFS